MVRFILLLSLAACSSEASYSWKWKQPQPDAETIRPLLIKLRNLAHEAEVSAALEETPPVLSWGKDCRFPDDGVCQPSSPQIEAFTQAVLISAGEAFPHEALVIDSGRSWSEWQPGRELFKRATDREAKTPWDGSSGVSARGFQVLLAVWLVWALLLRGLIKRARLHMPGKLAALRPPSGKVEPSGHLEYLLDRMTFTRGLMLNRWSQRRARLVALRFVIWFARVILGYSAFFYAIKPAGIAVADTYFFCVIAFGLLLVELLAHPGILMWWVSRGDDFAKVMGQRTFSFDSETITLVSAMGTTQVPWSNVRRVVSDDLLVIVDFGAMFAVIPRGTVGVERTIDVAQSKAVPAFSAY